MTGSSAPNVGSIPHAPDRKAAPVQPQAEPLEALLAKVEFWRKNEQHTVDLHRVDVGNKAYGDMSAAQTALDRTQGLLDRLFQLESQVRASAPNQQRGLILRFADLMRGVRQHHKEASIIIANRSVAANERAERVAQIAMDADKVVLDIAPEVAAAAVMLGTGSDAKATATKNAFKIGEQWVSNMTNQAVGGRQDLVDAAYGGAIVGNAIDAVVETVAALLMPGEKSEQKLLKESFVVLVIKPMLAVYTAIGKNPELPEKEMREKVKEALGKAYEQGINDLVHDMHVPVDRRLLKEFAAPLVAAILGAGRALLDHKPLKDGITDGIKEYTKRRAGEAVAAPVYQRTREGLAEKHGGAHPSEHDAHPKDGRNDASSHPSAPGAPQPQPQPRPGDVAGKGSHHLTQAKLDWTRSVLQVDAAARIGVGTVERQA